MASAAEMEPLSKQLTIIVGLTVVGFMTFGLAISFYRNVLFEETLKDMEANNHLIAQENDEKYRELDYYRSEQFKDKYAKENLGLVRQGEKILVITKPISTMTPLTESGSTVAEARDAAFTQFLSQMPVSEQWWLYLFDREKLTELRKTI